MEFRFVPLQSSRLTYKCVGLSVDQSNHVGLPLNQSNHLNDDNNLADAHSTGKQPKIIISTNFYRHDNNHDLDNNSNRYSCTSLKTRLSYTDDHGSESSSIKGHNLKQLQQTTTLDLNGISDREETPLSLLRRKQTKGIGKQYLVPFDSACGINRNRFSDNIIQQERPFSASCLPLPPFKATIYRPVNLLDVEDTLSCSMNKKRKRISDTTCVRLNRENIQKWLLEHGIRSRLRSFSSSNFHHWRRSGPFIEHGTDKPTSLLAHTTSQSHGDRLHEPCRSSLVITERLNRLAATPMTPLFVGGNKLRHSLRIEKKSVISLKLSRRGISSNERPISDVVHDKKTQLLLNQQVMKNTLHERKSDPVSHAWRAKNNNSKNEKCRVSFELDNVLVCETPTDHNSLKKIENKENTIIDIQYDDENSFNNENNRICSSEITVHKITDNGLLEIVDHHQQQQQQQRICSEDMKNNLSCRELRLLLTKANDIGNNKVV